MMRTGAILGLVLLASPAAAQTPAQLDSLRAEVVRSRAFIRAAETQLSKVLDMLSRMDSGPIGEPIQPDTILSPDTVAAPPSTATPYLDERFAYASKDAFLASDHYYLHEDFRPEQMTLDGGLRYDYPAGSSTDYTISRTLRLPSGTREAWIEVVLRFSPGFSLQGNGQSAGPSLKLLHIGVLPDGTGRFGLEMDNGNAGSVTAIGSGGWGVEWKPGISNATLLDGQWHRIGYRASTSGRVDVWIDGRHVGTRSASTSATAFWGVSLAKNLNMQPAEPQSLWWQRVTVYTSDPGWAR